MNARLEEEYSRYIAEHKGGAPVDTVTINIKDVAQHFYNLALEDVKKKLLNMLETSADNEHFFEQLDEFIDNQETK